jgi:general secretion pathway protein G
MVEIILVVVIIMTLAALVAPRVTGRAKSAKINATRIQINNIAQSLKLFEIQVGRFPTTEEGLAALVERPSSVSQDEWSDKFMDDLPLDSWKQEFQYKYPSEHGKDFDLVSAGPDKTFGTEDDITNFDDAKTKEKNL